MELKGGLREIGAYWPVAVVAAICAAVMLVAASGDDLAVTEREISIVARQWGFTPHRIFVNTGDAIELRLVSLDVVHGFYLEGHRLEAEIRPGKLGFMARDPSAGEDFREVESIRIVAGLPGKYRYRCSVTCGTLHPFMQGEMIVRPNVPYRAGIVGTFGITLAVFSMMLLAPKRNRQVGVSDRETGWRMDLLAGFALDPDSPYPHPYQPLLFLSPPPPLSTPHRAAAWSGN